MFDFRPGIGLHRSVPVSSGGTKNNDGLIKGSEGMPECLEVRGTFDTVDIATEVVNISQT